MVGGSVTLCDEPQHLVHGLLGLAPDHRLGLGGEGDGAELLGDQDQDLQGQVHPVVGPQVLDGVPDGPRPRPLHRVQHKGRHGYGQTCTDYGGAFTVLNL